ncbi:MAG: hypothetical protein FWC89_12645 [Defluviitaleaceae bacterium]|nr:hypothetical protein [Defluviitaleaceae bacterium]
MKWAEDESILRMFLRRIDDRRSPISNEIAILMYSLLFLRIQRKQF